MLEKKPKQGTSDLSFHLHKKKRTILALQYCYVHLVLNIKALFSSFYVNDLGFIINRIHKLPDLQILEECKGGKSPLPSLVSCLSFSRSDCSHLILAA